ncbi:MAG: hypothetical protein U0R51_08150 [Solirubrobacterales bacterium]
MSGVEHYSASARWIDPVAPFDLVYATVAVRDALAAPEPAYHNLGGTCREAARALALGLQRHGWDATCLPASRLGDDHLVALVGDWVLDPTAEQFGPDGPWVCRIHDLPHPDYELTPDPEWRIEPTEPDLIELMAEWGSCEETRSLLSATGLTALEEPIYELDEAFTAERLAEITSR